MNTLKVSWDPPAKPNGEILGYIVAYETAEQDESKKIFNWNFKQGFKCVAFSRLFEASEAESDRKVFVWSLLSHWSPTKWPRQKKGKETPNREVFEAFSH